MNENSIFNCWNTTKSLLDRNSSQPRIPDMRRRTALENLARRYRRFSILGIVMVPVSFSWVRLPELQLMWGPHDMRLWLIIFLAFYFGVISVVDHRLCSLVSRIDPVSMPVAEVVRRAMRVRRMHLLSIVCIAPFALLFIGVMIYIVRGNIYFLGGVVCGALTGLAVGIHQLYCFLNDYHDITRCE